MDIVLTPSPNNLKTSLCPAQALPGLSNMWILTGLQVSRSWPSTPRGGQAGTQSSQKSQAVVSGTVRPQWYYSTRLSNIDIFYVCHGIRTLGSTARDPDIVPGSNKPEVSVMINK